MNRLTPALLMFALAMGAAAQSATPQDPPPFNPASTDATPCGTGTPLPGHTPPDWRPSGEGGTITVRQDGKTLCYVVNGSADAPVIRVRQGEDLALTLQNEITNPQAIADMVAPAPLAQPNPAITPAAEFYSVLPGMRHPATGMTNLHLHGFAVPPLAPADEVLRTCTDPAVGPATCGRRAFTYRYHIPADMPAGLYWYHPHVHGEVQAQMLMGLTGAIVVEGPEDDQRRAAGIGERVLIVRQTQDLDAGQTPAAAGAVGDEMPPVPQTPLHKTATQIDTADELLCASTAGIDEITLNGARIPLGQPPDEALAAYTIPAGGKEFWRVLNAATDAFLDLVVIDQDGTKLPLEIVARDGAPLADDTGHRLHPLPTTEAQLVPPAGRLEFLVKAPPAGHKAYLITRGVDTGCAGDRLPERRMAVLTSGPASGSAPPEVTASLAKPSLFSGLLARKTDHRRVIALAEYPRPGQADQTDFYIVERRPGAVLEPYDMHGKPAITINAGTTEEWVVENWTNELHAFHIHQVHFRLLEVDGAAVPSPPLLDVVNVPYATATGYGSHDGPVRPGRVRIKIYFPEALAGDIPFHCHLVDHEDNGMMAVLRVLPTHTTILEQKAALPDLLHPPICRPLGETGGRPLSQ
jgi:FtsP/CotA-like multicopper oxidase with cupredoxin domain